MNAFLEFIFSRNFCNHSKLNLNLKFQYCPDCGELVEISWYVLRCSCCDIKRDACIRFGQVVAKDNFCSNCGEDDFYIQKIDDLQFYDIHHAVLFKEVISCSSGRKYTQIWTDSDESVHTNALKLLPMLPKHKSVS